ncbi:MAG TPA: hypothetical protein VGK65_16185, partial [Candidatus Binatia bacterium]
KRILEQNDPRQLKSGASHNLGECQRPRSCCQLFITSVRGGGATEDLPEFMPAQEFIRRFGGVDTPKYKQMMAQIERRFATLSLYR